MIVFILVLAYIANVFLNRWLAKILHSVDKFYDSLAILWFFSLFYTVVVIFIIWYEKRERRENINTSKFYDWFTGKNW
jgi:cbb3-type cytochrome oxidase subunit 3